MNPYLDGDLGNRKAGELLAHLETCSACGDELTELLALRSALAQWGACEMAPPRGFAERVAALVGSERTSQVARPERDLKAGLRVLDDRLGRVVLPGGRIVPVSRILGWGLATVAVAIGLAPRFVRRGRELKTSLGGIR